MIGYFWIESYIWGMKYLLEIDVLRMQAINGRLADIDAFSDGWEGGVDFTPEQLVELRQLAMVQSIGSSTRIEGSKLTDDDIAELIRHMEVQKLVTRDEQEAAGYFNVLEIILADPTYYQLSENLIKGLHKQLLLYSAKDEHHRGEYKKITNHVVANLKSGEQKIIFDTTRPLHTPQAMANAVANFEVLKTDSTVHPILAVAAFIYEFLTIHPFQDGNGRLSRLLTNLLLVQAGYDFIQYVSLEHEVEKYKADYYLALMTAQRQRGTDQERIGSWITFLLKAISRCVDKLRADKTWLAEEPAVLYLNRRQQRVMDYVREHETLSVGQLDKFFMTETSRNTVKYDLKRLTDAGFLKRLGKGRGTVYALNR